MSTPAEIVDLVDGYCVTWPDHHITLLIEYLQKQSQGLIGEVTITNGKATLCESLRINLNSEAKTKSIAKKVFEYEDRLSLPEWARLIESTCVLCLRRHREGEPWRSVTVDAPVEPLMFQINPLVFRGKPSVLFGDGGQGKSTFALLCAMLISTGETVAGIAALPGIPLFLDYEDSYDVHVRRMQAIAACHPHLKRADVRYQSCTEPLASLTHTLLRRIKSEGISFLVLDSLAAATGGDAGAEAATKVFRSIRALNVGSLILAHVPKPNGDGTEPSIYGSVFNKNNPRATWELRKEQEVGSDVSILALLNRKSNLSRTHPPIGLKVSQNFESTQISYEAFDLNQAAELQTALPLANQIRNLLEDGVPRSAKEITVELGAKLPSVKFCLSKHRGIKWNRIGEYHDGKWTVLNR